MKRMLLIIGLILCGICRAETEQSLVVPVPEKPGFPAFLPKYYKPILTINNQTLSVVNQFSTNGVVVVNFSSENKSLKLKLTHIECNHPQQRTVFNNIVGNLNRTISTNSGRFIEITETDLNAEITDSESVFHRIFVFVLPSSVQAWDFEFSPEDPALNSFPESEFERVQSLANRQRYNDALAEGNVSMGRWGDQINDYATWLTKTGEKEKARDVLRKHLVTTSFDYAAHVDFLSLTGDSAEASNHAGVVFKKAEKQDLIEQAAAVLGKKRLTLDDFPVLESGETGLQLILIPLPPCNPWILEAAGDMFQQITEVPVKICRLENGWDWGAPDRIFGERDVQEMLAKLEGHAIDFTGWTKSRYIDEMKSCAQSRDALTKYYIEKWIGKIEKEPGQYLIDPYVNRLCNTLEKIRSDDIRTMYVAITEANIYSGDNRFLFSQGREKGKSRASIFSYYMMRAETLNAIPSRQRLVERIGKELVPAALKQLGIPRSIDPDCPYSYANGVERLDQKTLVLADPVKEALTRLKNDPSFLPGKKIGPLR